MDEITDRIENFETSLKVFQSSKDQIITEFITLFIVTENEELNIKLPSWKLAFKLIMNANISKYKREENTSLMRYHTISGTYASWEVALYEEANVNQSVCLFVCLF